MQELKPDERWKIVEAQSENAVDEDEAGMKKEIETKGRSVVDLEKPVINENAANKFYSDKHQQQEMPFKANREEPLSEKSSKSFLSIIFC